MPGVIDSLVVLLGLDKSNFDKGQKDAQNSLKKTGDEAEKLRKRHEAEAKKTAEAYNSVRDSILGVTAAIVTAVAGGEFLSFLTKNDIAAGNLATNVGSVTKEVSALQGVFRRIGGSTGDADSFLRTTNKILQDIRFTGTSQALLPFAQFGLNTAAFRDAKSMQERMLMLSDAAKQMDPQKAQYFLQNAGYSENQVNLMLRGRAAIQKLIDDQQKLNVETEKDYELAKKRQEAWGGLEEALVGFGRSVARETSPVIAGITENLTKFVSYLSTDGGTAAASILLMAGAVTKLGGAMGIAGTAASTLLGRLGLYAAAAAGLYQIIHLLDLGAQYLGVKTRSTVEDSMTPELKARIAGGALKGLPDPFHSGGTGIGAYADVEKKWGLPAGLLSGIKWAETRGGSGIGARSPKGAMGPFQIMPPTWAQYGKGSPDDPHAAADASGHYLHDLLSMYGGNINSAIAAYNEGPGNFNKGYMPDETRNYLSTVHQGMSMAASKASAGVTIQNMNITTTASTLTGVGTDVARGMSNYTIAQQANNGIN